MNHASDPSYYACCHPLPTGGTADASCRAVGDYCEEGEENCVCEMEDEATIEGHDESDDNEAAEFGDEGGNQPSARAWPAYAWGI